MNVLQKAEIRAFFKVTRKTEHFALPEIQQLSQIRGVWNITWQNENELQTQIIHLQWDTTWRKLPGDGTNKGSTTAQVDKDRTLFLNLKSRRQKWIPKGVFPTKIKLP